MLIIQVQENDISFFQELKANYPQYVEIIRPDSLSGANEIVEVVVAVTAVSVPVIGKVLTTLIKNKKITSINYKGIEIDGISEKNVNNILNKLLEKENRANGNDRENNDNINTNLLHWREKWYVVYDRHFSQLLKDLNRIFFFEENEIDAYKIIAQIYAEELFLKGKFVKSGQFIDSFFKKDKKKYCMNPEFEEILKIQEAFIISHELAHWFYFRIQEKEKVSRALDMHYEKCRGYFDEVEREKTVQAADDKIIKLVFHYFKVNPGIQEESYCDISAITFLLAHFKVLSNLNSIEAAAAA